MKTLKNGEYEYRESDFLGEGSFAKVYKGVIVKNQRVVAIRLLPLKLIKQYGNKIKTKDKLCAWIVEKLPSATPNKLLSEARAYAERSYAPYMDEELASKAAAALTTEHLKAYTRNTETPHYKALAREEDRGAVRA